MSKDQDYIVRLEKAISQKYGEEATYNPKRFWDENKEKEYIQQSQEEDLSCLSKIFFSSS